MARRTLLRIGAIAAPLGVLVLFMAEMLHGGHDPADLEATLPEYAENDQWELVHFGQFIGYLLVFLALVALHRSITDGRGAALSRLGVVTALLATGVYAVNQAVDGVGIKHVADSFVSAPDEEKATALRVAEAVRHVEIGLTSFAEFTWGVSLLLFGAAILLSVAYPAWLGWSAMIVGVAWVVVGLLVAHNGFTEVTVTMMATLLMATWLIAAAVFMWRKAGSIEEPHDAYAASSVTSFAD